MSVSSPLKEIFSLLLDTYGRQGWWPLRSLSDRGDKEGYHAGDYSLPATAEQRYEVMIHSIGLEEESPSVAYLEDPQPNGDRVLRENMVLVAELYCGEVGAREGVKLGDQLVLTSSGVRDLVPYPYCEALLGETAIR